MIPACGSLPVAYTRRQLLALRHTVGPKLCTVMSVLSCAGLLHYRGNRAGVRSRDRRMRAHVYQQSLVVCPLSGIIPIVPSYRSVLTVKSRTRPAALVSVDCSATFRSVNIGTLNARSLGNKSAAVSQLIVDNRLDLFAVVESWHDSSDSTSVVASTPPGYRVVECSRPRTGKAATGMKTNHGGICVFVRSNINVKVINFPSYKSFELLSLFVRIGAASFVLVVVYRPDPESAVTDKFFVDWADVLERTASFAGCFITGDINLYVEAPRMSTQRGFVR